MKTIVSKLNSSREMAEAVHQIIGLPKNMPIYFIGYRPSDLLVSMIDFLIHEGFCQNVVITNMEEETCHCGGANCACQWLKDKLLPDNVFLFDNAQNPDLVKIVPKLGESVIWVVNTDHPQQNEIVQWISS
jgi:hypothetical protein